MAESKAPKAKSKRPTAQKRQIQNEKKQAVNSAFKSRVKTALRRFEEASSSGDTSAVTERLATVYSLMDKGVKRGIFKVNKASRVKSRLTKRSAS